MASLEADLLRRHGHEVERLIVSTSELQNAGSGRLAGAALSAVWSRRGYRALRKAVAGFVPDIVHVHNTFPLLSPSIFWAAKKAGVPVVQTLHNFRTTCANALLLRDGKACEQCVGRFPWPALRYRCYRQSLPATAVVVATNLVHRRLRTFRRKVDACIALSEFSKAILVRSGLPADKIFVKPNFVAASHQPARERLHQVVFAGKISQEKGVHLLLQAWGRVRLPAGRRLLLFGDGPDRAGLEQQFAADSSIVWCGTQSREQVMAEIASSRLLVLPSLCYENCPMAVLEAFSVGTPVVVPDHGPFPEMVSHRKDGLLFSSGNMAVLADALDEGLKAPAEAWSAWSRGALDKYLAQYSESPNYQRLMSIYEHARGQVQRNASHAGSVAS